VVDLDGELPALLCAAEEVLLCLGLWEHDDRQNAAADSAAVAGAVRRPRRPHRRAGPAHRSGADPVPRTRVGPAARSGRPLRARVADRAHCSAAGDHRRDAGPGAAHQLTRAHLRPLRGEHSAPVLAGVKVVRPVERSTLTASAGRHHLQPPAGARRMDPTDRAPR
jgi:hypothetical protein